MPSPRTVPSLTGQELAALRREAGLTQTQFAHLAGIGRHAVSRWEQVPSVDPWGWAPKRMLKVLGVRIVPHSQSISRGRAGARDGVLLPSLDEPILAVSRRVVRPRAIGVVHPPHPAPCLCGARTRKGMPCQMRAEPRRQR